MFDGDGRATYDPGMMGVMHGVVGDYVLANGQSTRRDRSSGGCPPSVHQCRHWCADRFELGTSAVWIATDQGMLLAPLGRRHWPWPPVNEQKP